MAMLQKILPTLRDLRMLGAAAFLLCLAPAMLSAQATQAVTPPVANRLTQPVDENARVTLKGTVHPLANAANDRGAAPDSMPLDRIQILLQRSPAQESALKQLITDMHTPGTGSYHKWLTPDQFGKQFGPSDQDIATLEAWLQSKGFSVTKVNPGKQTLEVSGSVAQFRTAFSTQIHKDSVNGETHYANASDPQIPAALAPVFGGFASLNNFRPKRQSHSLGKATYDPKTNKATPQWTIGSASTGYSFVLSPADYAIQYDLQPLYAAGVNGTGQTIAIINDTNINVATVNQFRSLFNLPVNPPQVIIDGNDPGIDGINNPDGPNGDSIEAYLDVEWSGAVAPNATVDLVIGADTALQSGLVLAAEHAVFSNVAPVMSLSFGNCESLLGSGNQFWSGLWEQAAAQGITVMVSAGDAGSAGCDNDNRQFYAVGGQAVSGFASTPYNVAVGGTDFYYSSFNQGSTAINSQLATYWNTTPSNNTPTASILGVIPEQPWNDSQYGLNLLSIYSESGNTETSIAGGSGGASNCALGTGTASNGGWAACTGGYPKPAWQSGTGVPADKVRDIPDVSLFAADGAGNASFYPECWQDGDCQPASSGSTVQLTAVGGTSASSPAFAGIMALVNQKYGPQGQANFVLYPLAAQFPQAFHDVTVGTNSVPCAISPISPDCIAVANPVTVTDPALGQAVEGQIGTGTTAEYNAGTGYDLATGLGTIDANQLVTNWNKVTFGATSVALTSPTAGTTITHGMPVTFTGTVTGTGTTPPSGDVAIETDSTTPLQAGQTFFTLANGAFTGSTSILPGGTYDVWANYGGDTANASAASAKTRITVNPEPSTLYFNVLTTNSNGQLVSANGTTGIPYGTQLILDGAALPTTYYNQCINTSNPPSSCSSTSITSPSGTVAFTDSGAAINTAVVNAEGDAEFYNAAWAIGNHSVSASYSGDASYSASSASTTFSIVKATPSVLVTTKSTTVAQGQGLVLTILVEGLGVGVAPTGTVSISGGPTGTPASATLTATTDPNFGVTAGVATITIPTTAPTTGSLAVPADMQRRWFLGGGAAFACVLLLTIPARRRSWRSILSLVVVSILAVGFTLGCGGGTGGGGTGSGGTTTGAYTVAVSYAGDGNYNSASGSLPITVAAASTLQTSTTAVTTTASTTSPTASIGTTVTVSGVTGHPAPTGTVQIYGGVISTSNPSNPAPELLAEGTLTAGSGTTSTYTATFNSQNLFQGANLLTVQYVGDTVYAPSSATLNLSNPLSDFSMIAIPATGGTATVNVAQVNGFSGAVTLQCSAAGVTCAINPASVSLASGTTTGSATATLTGAVSGQVYNVLITGSANSGTVVHTLSVQVVAP
jgi:subtilase family serine protease